MVDIILSGCCVLLAVIVGRLCYRVMRLENCLQAASSASVDAEYV